MMAELFDRYTTKEGAGVYGLYCAATDKWYIGASKQMVRRIKDHLAEMQISPLHSSMGADCKRYGIETIPAYILERIDDLSLLEDREVFYFDNLSGYKGYNTQYPGQNRHWK